MPSWTSPRASARTLPISRVIARARRSLCCGHERAEARTGSRRASGPACGATSGSAVSAALMAIATSAVGALLEAPDDVARVGRVAALERLRRESESTPLAGDEVPERSGSRRRSRSCRRVCGHDRVRPVRRPSRRSRRRRGTAWRGRSGPRGGASSWRSVATIRAPLAPIGWPRAIAPPLTLTLSQSKPSCAAVGQGLRGERLVDLDEVEGLDRQLDPVEQPADALDRGEEQPLRRDLGLGVADDPGERLEAVAAPRPARWRRPWRRRRP